MDTIYIGEVKQDRWIPICWAFDREDCLKKVARKTKALDGPDKGQWQGRVSRFVRAEGLPESMIGFRA